MKILFASRLVAYKNLTFVYSAISEMKRNKSWPANSKFLVMGSGPEEGHLRKLMTDLDIKTEVTMLGIVNEERVLEETKGCSFVLAPALTEFSPNFVLRGISMGKPFLISGENGLAFATPPQFVFDPRDKNDFIAKLRWIIEHEDEARILVSEIKFKQSWNDVLSANVKIIRQVIGP